MKRFWLANNNLSHYIATSPAVFIDPAALLLSSSVASQSSSSGNSIQHIQIPRHFAATFSKSVLAILFLLVSVNIYAQPSTDEQKQVEYKKTVTERVTKIVNTLEISNDTKYQQVLAVIANQYFQLNTIHEQNTEAVKAIKAKSQAKEETEPAIKAQEEKKSASLLQQHAAFLALLKEILTDQQIEKVKDAMTYRVFPITYAAYQDMLPNLTAEQKEKIYNWLKEARELAMDAESSDKKHAVFGKYKGRINNYLSAAGIDMKKEGEEWQKRIKEREAKAKEQKGS
jgi:hypothetical protein